MLPLLLACALLQPTPTIELTVAPVAASHAQTLPLEALLWAVDLPPGVDDRLVPWAQGDRGFSEGLMRDGWLAPAVLQVSADQVSLHGAQVLPLVDGVAGPQHTRGLLIHPLFDALQETVSRNHTLDGMAGVDRDLQLLLAIDGAVPWATVQAVLYTAGQAEIEVFWFLVSDPTAGPWSEPTFSADSRSVHLEVGTDGLMQRMALYPEPPDPTRGTVSQVLAAGFSDPSDVDCAFLVPHATHTWADVVPPLDTLNAAGVPQVLFGSTGAPTASVTAAPHPAPVAQKVPLSAQVAVFRMELPRIGPPGSSTEPEKGECHLHLEADVLRAGALDDLGVFDDVEGLGADLDAVFQDLGGLGGLQDIGQLEGVGLAE